MTDVPIRLLKGFLTQDQTRSMVEHIDALEARSAEKFRHDCDGTMVYMEFGKDVERPKDVRDIEVLHHSQRTLHTLDDLDSQPRLEIVNHFNRVMAAMKSEFSEPNEVYVNEFRIAKYYPGGTIELHIDTDEGFSSHLDYSAIIYLNTMTDGGGQITFTDHGYTYSPEEGDLIIFTSTEGGYHKVTEVLQTRYSLALWCTTKENYALY